MSRHRFVRNINIHDELDEDFGHEEDPFEGITLDQQAQLDASTEKVLSVLGPEQDTLVTEAEIRRQLWDSYFDVDSTAEWALGEHQRGRIQTLLHLISNSQTNKKGESR